MLNFLRQSSAVKLLNAFLHTQFNLLDVKASISFYSYYLEKKTFHTIISLYLPKINTKHLKGNLLCTWQFAILKYQFIMGIIFLCKLNPSVSEKSYISIGE